jgi:hypothetical protein
MSYEIPTVKVDLDEGKGWNPLKKRDSVVFFKEIRHGTQKAVNAMTRQFLTFPNGQNPKLVVSGEKDMRIEGVESIDVDLARVDFDAVNDVLILGQVKEWSFGPVDQETLDSLSEDMRNKLVEEVNKLYGASGPFPKGGGGNSAKPSSKR